MNPNSCSDLKIQSMDSDSPKSHSELPNSDPKPTPKRRKKNSIVWDHFTIVTVNPSCTRASCNHCKKSFAYVSGDKPSGTSHLLRHIEMGICSVARKEKDQLIPSPSTSRADISANRSNLQRKRCRAANGVSRVLHNRNNNNTNSNVGRELAKMIIQHDYPLHMVEQTGFISFARSLHPQFNITSVGLVQNDILGIYKRNKQIVMELLSGIPGRVNLTLDFWTSNHSLDYLLLTGHFTDQDWRLQKRVFSFSLLQSLPNPNSDTAFNSAIASCLSDWSLEGKIFTITLDRGHYANRESLRNVLSIKNSDLLKGQLLINGCYGRLLRTLALDAIGSMQETVQKVRHSVKYIKTSNVHEERFNQLKHLLQVPSTKKLIIDDLMRWDTTYLMLTAACEVKQVFSCFDTSDPDYKSTPSMEEWGQVETLCSVLKIFYNAACDLTSDSYPTANMFFLGASFIRLELMHATWSHDLLLSTLVKPLHEKYTKYWEDNCLMLSIAGILDPRFKLEHVDLKLKSIYGKDSELTLALRTSLSQLFGEYEKMMYMEMNEENLVKTDILLAEGDDLLNFNLDMSDIMGESHVIKSEFDDGFFGSPVFHPNLERVFHVKSELGLDRSELELDRYLEDPIVPNVHEFDIMGWWKTYGLNYPVLSKMACDVLSVPFCTVPLESIFDTRGRRLDSYQGSMCAATLEAMVCAKDWLQYDENGGSTVTSEA